MTSSIPLVRSRAGFTLIEMVLVLAVIALLIGAGVTHLVGVNTTAMSRTTNMKLHGLATALELYQLNAGRYPTEQQGLNALLEQPTLAPLPKSWSPQVKSPDSLVDPWNKPIQYRVPGRDGAAYDLFSFGRDGIENLNDIYHE